MPKSQVDSPTAPESMDADSNSESSFDIMDYREIGIAEIGNLNLSCSWLEITPGKTYGDLNDQFKQMKPNHRLVALAPTFGPYPFFRYPSPSEPISPSVRRIFVFDQSKFNYLVVVRTIDEDAVVPITLFEEDNQSLTIDAMKGHISSHGYFPISVRDYTGQSEIGSQNVETTVLYSEKVHPTIAFVETQKGGYNFRTQFRKDIPVTESLKFLLARGEALIQRASHIDIQLLHLARAMVHLIVSAQEVVGHCNDLHQLLDQLEDRLKSGAYSESNLIQDFYRLCEDYPGAVAVRRSYSAFLKLGNHAQTILPKPLIPVSRNYVQRQHIYDFLTEKLLPSSSAAQQRRCILHGLGGGGKTQLASFWIEMHKKKFSRIIVVDSSSRQQIEADLESVIRSTDPKYRHSKATWKDAVAYLSDEKGWLMVFDNADEPDLHLHEYIPNTIHGTVIVTTRNRELVAYAQDSHIQVGQLTESEAVDLLQKVADVAPHSNHVSLAIVRELGMWALAITQAGAYIFRTRRLDTYLSTLQKHRDKLMREASLGGRNYQSSMYVAFDLSFGLLPKDAQDLMKVCSFLHYSFIPQALFRESAARGFHAYAVLESCPPPSSDETIISGLKDIIGSYWDEFSFQLLIDSISRGSLIDISIGDDGEPFYTLHPLVQTYIRDLSEGSHQDHYALLAGQLLLGAIRPLDGEGNAWYRLLSLHVDNLPMVVKLSHPSHALAFVMVHDSIGNWNASQIIWEYCYSQLCQVLGPLHPDTVLALGNLASTLRDRGELEEAERIQRDVLASRVEILGPRHPDAVKAMSNLAYTLHSRGQLEEAEKMQREVLALRIEILGPRHPDTLLAMNDLATTLQNRGRLEEAENMQRKILSQRAEVLGPRHPDTILVMNNLAITCHERGQLGEAEKMQLEVLALRKELLGPRHPDTIIAMHNLAITLRDRGQLEEAEKMQREVLSLREEILGSRHPDTARAISNLAITLLDLGQLNEAEKMQREVLALQVEILGPRHPDTARAMNNLASTLLDLGLLEEAERMQREVLALQVEILGKCHPDTVLAMSDLAITLQSRGRLVEAEKIEEEALDIRMKILGPRHPDTARSMSNLASTFLNLGRLNEAEKMQREVVELQVEILGPRHPDTARAMNYLASTLMGLGRLDEAEKMQREALDLQMEILGPEHPNTILVMHNLATTLRDRGQLEEAEKIQREVLSLRAQILGQRHPDTARAMNNLASTILDLGRRDEAEEMQRKVLALQVEILGEHHPDTVLAMNNLAITLRDRGRLEEAEKMQRAVLALLVEMLGSRHPDTVLAMGNLAITLQERGQLEDAETMERDVLALRKEILGSLHPDTVSTMGDLAHTLRGRGQVEEAEELQREVLSRQKRSLGLWHPHTVLAMANLAVTLHARGQLEEAEKMDREVLVLRTKVLGPVHPDTILAMSNLAHTLHDRGHLEEAERMQREAFDLQNKVLGRHHPATLTVMSNLASTLRARGQLDEAEKMEQEAIELRKETLGSHGMSGSLNPEESSHQSLAPL
ncbi:hypothetical protein FRC18_009510 [Serendipita sp. 400]|nr:hypothetical protein FRC18_009510 [Serendipita sp. 400]